jgi:hypothetical protein
MPTKALLAVDLMTFKCRTLKVKGFTSWVKRRSKQRGVPKTATVTLLPHILSRQFGLEKTDECNTWTNHFTGDKTAKRQIHLHFLDMTPLNSFHLWKVCGTKVTPRDIQLSLL